MVETTVLKFAISSGFFIILDYKVKNDIPQKSMIFFTLIMMIVLRLVNIDLKSNISELYDDIILLLIPIIILGGYSIFHKNKIYFFKGIDKKLIKENQNEIIKIIENYKFDNLDYKSDITFAINKIVFEDVKKQHVKECLSLVGSFLDENRKVYSL